MPKWVCNALDVDKMCSGEGKYVVTRIGNEEGSWNAKTARCKRHLLEEFPNGDGLSYLEEVDNHSFATVPYNATNNVQEVWHKLFG